ncbi:MAG: hypothetical protein Q9167_003610 [Letrouitia subvulpina]
MTTAVVPPNVTTSSSVFASGNGREGALLDSLIPFFDPNLPVEPAITEVPATSTAQVTPKAPALRFVNITTNPEVERKSHENRRLVRSAAMKHAVRWMKGDKQRPSTIKGKRKDAQENEDEPRSDHTGKKATTSGFLMPNARDQIRHNQADSFNPYSLDPLSTFPVQALPQEVDLARFQMGKMKGPFCIFYSWFNMPESENLMLRLVMSTPVLYHALLYMATVNFVGVNQNRLVGLRNALVHERKIIGMVQRELNKPIQPSEEIIFGTGMLAISQIGIINLEVDEPPAMLSAPRTLTRKTPLFEQSRYSSTSNAPYAVFKYLALHRVLDADLADYMDRLNSLYPPAQRRRWTGLSDFARDEQRYHEKAVDQALLAWQEADYCSTENISTVDNAARAAGLLYYHLVHRTNDNKTIDPLVDQLQSELIKLHSKQNLLWVVYHGCSNRLALIVWMLYCGGVHAQGEQRAWYVDQIRIAAPNVSWAAIKGVLQNFVYNEEVCQPSMMQLWVESLEF